MQFGDSKLAPRTLLAGLLAVVVAGCSGGPAPEGPTGTVSGKVTFKGQPVTVGQIMFTTPQGDMAFSDIAEDGSYSLKWRGLTSKVPIGDYQVSIKPPPSPPSTDDTQAPPKASHPSIPEKYHSKATSEFTLSVKEGENTKDFDMQ